jgi:hypothetical protein
VKSLKGKRLGSVWACVRIGFRVGIRGSVEGWFTPIHAGFMKPTSRSYFWRALVSIGSLALATEKLGAWKADCGWLNTLVDTGRLVD